MAPRRRALLASLASLGTAAAAGCLTNTGETATADPSVADDASSASSESTDTGGAGTTGSTLRLRALDGLPTDGTVHVHPRALARLLERGVNTDGTVRTHDRALLQGQSPLLAGERTLRVDGSAVQRGVYTLAFDGGPRYEWLVGATAVDDPPADADVLDLDALSSDRRSVVREAIAGGRVTVYPETPLGTWVRTEFVGGYVRHDGTVYRGRERQQTDAAFFADEVWYVGTVTAAEDDDPAAPTLVLDPLPTAARRAVDDLLGAWASNRAPVETDIGTLPTDARDALGATDAVLTHVAAFEVSVD